MTEFGALTALLALPLLAAGGSYFVFEVCGLIIYRVATLLEDMSR